MHISPVDKVISKRPDNEDYNNRVIASPNFPLFSITHVAAVRIQSIFRAQQLRKDIVINRMGQGVIKVEINKSRFISSSIKIKSKLDFPEGNKIVYFALNQKYFKGKITSSKDSDAKLVECNSPCHNENEQRNASSIESIMINGGYYNYFKRSSSKHEDLAPIGKMVADNMVYDSLPIPDKYLEDYGEIKFSDDSVIMSAPILTQHGVPVFVSSQDTKYQLEKNFSFDTGFIVPGELKHAADRNPRAAISLPDNKLEGVARVVVCIAKNRKLGGMTLPEWSLFLSRLDRINTPPSSSINLDGGGSVRIIAKMSSGKKVVFSQNKTLNPIANYIEFRKIIQNS